MAGLDDLAVQLGAVRARLQEAGETALVRSLADAIGKAVEPVEQEVRGGLDAHLPNRYAEVIGSELDISRRTWQDPDGAKVTVYARTTGGGKRKLQRLDDGILWHPLFGRYPRGHPRNRWFGQGADKGVQPGWFSGPARDAAPPAREEIEKALDDVVAKVVHP